MIFMSATSDPVAPMEPNTQAGVPGGIALPPGGTPGIDPAQMQMQLPGSSPLQPPVTPTPVLSYLSQNPKAKATPSYTDPSPEMTPSSNSQQVLLQLGSKTNLPGKDHNLYWLPVGDEIRGLEEEVREKEEAQRKRIAHDADIRNAQEARQEEAQYNADNHNPSDSDSPVEPTIHGWEPPLAKGLAQTNPYNLNSDAFEDRRLRRRRLLSYGSSKSLRGRTPPNNPEDLWSTMQTKGDPYPSLLNGGGAQGKGYVMPAMTPEGKVEIPGSSDNGQKGEHNGPDDLEKSALPDEREDAAAVAADLANVASFTVPKGTFG